MVVLPRPPRRAHATSLWATAAAVSAAAALLAAVLLALRPALPEVLPGYGSWLASYHQAGSFLRWILGDTTESEYAKTGLSGAAMLLGAAVAHLLYRRRSRRQGFAISYGTGLWPWITTSAALGLVLSNVAWGWTIPATGVWQPTFVPFVSVPPAVVLVYGAGWAVALTGAVLGAALTTPVALLVVNFVCNPLGLPGVIGSTTGMWVGALIAFALCPLLPWMPRPLTAANPQEDPADTESRDRQGPVWVARRILADFTEAQFYGNEWASAALILATVLAFVLNPALPVYGSGLLPQVLVAQVLTAAIGVVVWRRKWAQNGWYPTFVPVVSVAPATVLTLGGSVQVVVAAAVLGALASPPIAAAVARRLPAHFHPFIGNVVSMTLCTTAIVVLLNALPGF